CPATAFTKRGICVDRQPRPFFHPTAQPVRAHLRDLPRIPKPEQHSCIVRGAVARICPHTSPQDWTLRAGQCDTRSAHVAVRLLSLHAQPQPMLSMADIVDEETRRAVVINNEDVRIAVVIHISEGHPSTPLRYHECRARLMSNIPKVPISKVSEQQLRLVEWI